MFLLFHWPQAFFFFFSMKNEVYWGLRGSSVFWLYNVEEIKEKLHQRWKWLGAPSLANKSNCVSCTGWPMRFQKGPTKGMKWDLYFYEPLFICLFNAQLKVMLSFNSLHSSFGDSWQWAICQSQRGMRPLKLPPWSGWKRDGFEFHLASERKATLTQALMRNYLLAQLIIPC